jgi:hypothetical protein
MAERDNFNALEFVQALESQVISGSSDVNGADVDVTGGESVSFVFNVGQTGDTLSGSLNFDVKLQHRVSGGTYSDVGSSNLIGGSATDFLTIDDNSEDEALYAVGYSGNLDEVRCVVQLDGTHSSGTEWGAVAVIGDQVREPTSNTVTP